MNSMIKIVLCIIVMLGMGGELWLYGQPCYILPQPNGNVTETGWSCIINNTGNTTVYQGTTRNLLSAERYIELNEGFLADPSFSKSNGLTEIRMEQNSSCSPMNASILVPTSGHNSIDKFEMMEWGVQPEAWIMDGIKNFLENNTTKRAFWQWNDLNTTTNTPLNPYDPADIDFYAEFIDPNGKLVYRPGFFYTDTVDFTFAGGNGGALSNPQFDEFLFDDPWVNNQGESNSKCPKIGISNAIHNGWINQYSTYSFRVRYAPNMDGPWKVKLKMKINGGAQCFETPFYPFEVEPSSKKGYVELSSDPHYFQYSEGDRLNSHEFFFPVGYNIWSARPGSMYSDVCKCIGKKEYMDLYTQSLQRLSNSQGNLFRVGCDATHFNIEWEDLGNYFNRMGTALELDRIVKYAELNDLHFIIALFSHHDMQRAYNGQDVTNWDFGQEFPRSGGFGPQNHWYSNPYRYDPNAMAGNRHTRLKGVISAYDLFRPSQSAHLNADLNKLMKNRIRYYVARWGYSPNLLAWEVMDEIQQQFSDHILLEDGEKEGFFNWNPANPDLTGYGKFYSIFPNSQSINLLNVDPALTQCNVKQWLEEMGDYLKVDLKVPQLLTYSQVGAQDNQFNQPNKFQKLAYEFTKMPQYDIWQIHSYTTRFDQNIDLRNSQVQDFRNQMDINNRHKAFIFGEMGSSPETTEYLDPTNFHNSLWATAFMGTAAPGLSWYWPQLDGTYNLHKLSSTYSHDRNTFPILMGVTNLCTLAGSCSPTTTNIAVLPANGGLASITSLVNFLDGEDLRGMEPVVTAYPVTGSTMAVPAGTISDKPALELYYLKKPDQSFYIGWMHNRTYWNQSRAKYRLDHPQAFTSSLDWLNYDYALEFLGNSNQQQTYNYTTFNWDPVFCGSSEVKEHCKWIKGTLTFDENIPLGANNFSDNGFSNPLNGFPESNPCDCKPTQNHDMTYLSKVMEPYPLNNLHLKLPMTGQSGNCFLVEITKTKSTSSFPGWSTTVQASSTGLDVFLTNILTDWDNSDYSFKVTRTTCKSSGDLSDQSGFPSFAAYLVPNPAQGQVEVRLEGNSVEDGMLQLTDLNGKVLWEGPSTGSSTMLDIRSYPNGIYLVKVVSAGYQKVLKLVIQ